MTANIAGKVRQWRLGSFTGPDGLSLSVRDFVKLDKNEVLVKIRAISLNRRDIIISMGGDPNGSLENLIPCSDMAGEVIAVGDSVSSFKIGDRVSANFTLDHIDGDPSPETKATALGGPIDGVLADHRAFPSHSLVLIPNHLSFEEASTLPCAALSAYNALFEGPGPIRSGSTVLTQGTGGVSMFALQFAVAAGATVIATSSSDDKLHKVHAMGANKLINYREIPQWHNEVLKQTHGTGVDRVVEVAGTGSLIKSMQATKYAGMVSIVGMVGDPGNMSLFLMYMIQRKLTMQGIQVGSRKQFDAMNKFITQHRIHPVIQKVFEFKQAPDAFRYLDQEGVFGKVVIRVD